MGVKLLSSTSSSSEFEEEHRTKEQIYTDNKTSEAEMAEIRKIRRLMDKTDIILLN